MSPSIDHRENRELAGEVKFVVPSDMGAHVRTWARANLVPDPNAAGAAGDEYRITSIYFDTAAFDVFQRRGSYGRSKFRVRRYGESEQVFLERKLKTRGLVSKRRSLVPIGQLAWLARDGAASRWGGRWYARRLKLRALHPVCQIAYDRTARVMMSSTGPVRMTVDQNVVARTVQECQFQEFGGTPVSPDAWIVELKFRSQLPALFKQLIQEFALKPQPISKYRLAVQRLGIVPVNLLDGGAAPANAPAYA